MNNVLYGTEGLLRKKKIDVLCEFGFPALQFLGSDPVFIKSIRLLMNTMGIWCAIQWVSVAVVFFIFS